LIKKKYVDMLINASIPTKVNSQGSHKLSYTSNVTNDINEDYNHECNEILMVEDNKSLLIK